MTSQDLKAHLKRRLQNSTSSIYGSDPYKRIDVGVNPNEKKNQENRSSIVQRTFHFVPKFNPTSSVSSQSLYQNTQNTQNTFKYLLPSIPTENKSFTSNRSPSPVRAVPKVAVPPKLHVQHQMVLRGPLTPDLNQKYKSEAKMGEGSYGTVFRVQNRLDGTYRAVKMIRLDYNDEEGLSADAFIELSILKKLNHPNVIHAYEIDYDSQNERLGIVMDLATTTLTDQIEQWGYDLKDAGNQKTVIQDRLHISYGIICGLNYIHENEVLHLDIKTSNILLNVDSSGLLHALISDFGIADLQDGMRTKSNNKITWPYRPPEIQCETGEYTTSADTWSLGVMLCEIFFSFDPFYPPEDERHLYSRQVQQRGYPSKSLQRKFQQSSAALCPLPQYFARSSAQSQYNPIRFTLFKDNVAEIQRQEMFYGKIQFQNILDLIDKCLRYEPYERIRMSDAINHPLFDDLKKKCRCLNCQIQQGFRFDRHAQDIQFSSSLLPFIPPGNSLYDYAHELHRRYTRLIKPDKKNSSMYTDEQIQAGCISISQKLLRYPLQDREIVRQKAGIKTYEELNNIEIHIAITLNWNFDGPAN